jgi:hypothetical protein
LRPDILKDPNLPSGQQSVNRWFDTTAFAPPQTGHFGTSAKGVIKGPGVNVWHVGFHKDFIFTERMRLRWEMTAVNFFNHPNWGNPGMDITDDTGLGASPCGSVTSGPPDRSRPAIPDGLRFQF